MLTFLRAREAYEILKIYLRFLGGFKVDYGSISSFISHREYKQFFKCIGNSSKIIRLKYWDLFISDKGSTTVFSFCFCH